MACLEGFVPHGAFRFKKPTRFVSRRVTCFGNAPAFYERLEPGEAIHVEVDLHVVEGLAGECDVVYETLHGDPSGEMLLELKSNVARIKF